MKDFIDIVKETINNHKNNPNYRPRRGRTTGLFGHKRQCGGTSKLKK